MLRTLHHACLTAAVIFTAFCGLSQQDLPLIQHYCTRHASEWQLQPEDVAALEIVSTATSKAPGVHHCYVRQTFNGLPVVNGLATVTVKNGAVVSVASRFKRKRFPLMIQPSVSAISALLSAAGDAGIPSGLQPELMETDQEGRVLLFSGGGISRQSIPVKLVYVADNTGKMELSWDFSLLVPGNQHWWSYRISAESGKVIERNDWIQHCSFEGKASDDPATAAPFQEQSSLLMPPPPGSDQYLVYALPVESPNHGDRSLVVNPSDVSASPYGWHDTDGFPGDEYTITRGNNVYASEDIDDDDFPGYSPDGTAALDFDFPYDSAVGVQGNLDVVITQLFYMNNMMHDIWYQYGFDEGSGNFQQTNYTGEGLGEDFVFADAQDGSGTNNANFGTPPEGFNPRMQMYLWSDNNVPDLLTVNDPQAIAGSYNCSTAGFGPPVPSSPLTADFVLVNDDSGEPTDACDVILNGAELNGKIALVRRGSCTFEEKVVNCQAYGAIAVIVMNNVNGQPISMGGSVGGAMIPSVMVSKANGDLFANTVSGGTTVNGTLVNPGDLTATDSDLDNGVIAHEYGHGISTRLTGGAADSDCLWNEEQMGEGWSDWFGMMITMKPEDAPEDPRGVGTYVTNQPVNGTGIRPAPYSTDFSVNPYTYAATNNTGAISQPHGIGFVWATMLWDLNWALIGEYGFDPDMKYGTGGNNIAMSLVIEGIKLQPCGPGFVDGRDAILTADQLLYGGEHHCLIWEVFARRGLGFSADQGDPDSRIDQTEAFDLPPACIEGAGIGENGLSLVLIYPNPVRSQLTVDMSNYQQVSSVRITDLQGKTVYENLKVSGVKLTIDLAKFQSGMYLVHLTDENGARSVQVVKH